MAELKIGETIEISGDLPRIVQVLEGKEGAIKPYPGNKIAKGKVVALNAGSGKSIGVELEKAPNGYRWYDAHGCDGKAKSGFGWWITEGNIVSKK